MTHTRAQVTALRNHAKLAILGSFLLDSSTKDAIDRITEIAEDSGYTDVGFVSVEECKLIDSNGKPSLMVTMEFEEDECSGETEWKVFISVSDSGNIILEF